MERQRTLVAAVSSFARTLLHVYYASGQEHAVLALGSVALWCTIWSTVNLAAFYWAKNLTPIIVGHGIANIFVTNTSGDWQLTGALPVAVHCVELTTIAVLIVGASIYVISDARTAAIKRRREKAQQPIE